MIIEKKRIMNIFLNNIALFYLSTLFSISIGFLQFSFFFIIKGTHPFTAVDSKCRLPYINNSFFFFETLVLWRVQLFEEFFTIIFFSQYPRLREELVIVETLR